MAKHLSRWTLTELKQFLNEHGPLLVVRDDRTGRVNKRSYYNAVKRYIKRNRPTPLYKLKMAELIERIEAENIPLPEHGSGRMGHIIMALPPLKKITNPKKNWSLTSHPLTVEGIYANGT